ncbi:MAG: hypothetical protein LBH71_03615 [Oscillospiraceae bacterium]|nr:hypothetical protein [Oscillospiraceae bacterium]
MRRVEYDSRKKPPSHSGSLGIICSPITGAYLAIGLAKDADEILKAVLLRNECPI